MVWYIYDGVENYPITSKSEVLIGIGVLEVYINLDEFLLNWFLRR